MMCAALSKEIDLKPRKHPPVPHDARLELKYSFTGDLGDANVGHYEVTLYFLEHALQAPSDESGPKAKSVRKARFWLSPKNGGHQQ